MHGPTSVLPRGFLGKCGVQMSDHWRRRPRSMTAPDPERTFIADLLGSAVSAHAAQSQEAAAFGAYITRSGPVRPERMRVSKTPPDRGEPGCGIGGRQ